MEQITQDKRIESIVSDILNNKSFSDSCKSIFEEIYKDKKLDSDDIPQLIQLILIVYNNKNNIKVNKKNTKRVLMLLIFKLIEIYIPDTNNKIENYQLVLLIEPQIDLILFRLDDCNFNCCCYKSKNKQEEDTKSIIVKIKKTENKLVKTNSSDKLKLNP